VDDKRISPLPREATLRSGPWPPKAIPVMPGHASWFWRVWSSQISVHRHMKVVPTVFTRQAIFLLLIRPKTYTGE